MVDILFERWWLSTIGLPECFVNVSITMYFSESCENKVLELGVRVCILPSIVETQATHAINIPTQSLPHRWQSIDDEKENPGIGDITSALFVLRYFSFRFLIGSLTLQRGSIVHFVLSPFLSFFALLPFSTAMPVWHLFLFSVELSSAVSFPPVFSPLSLFDTTLVLELISEWIMTFISDNRSSFHATPREMRVLFRSKSEFQRPLRIVRRVDELYHCFATTIDCCRTWSCEFGDHRHRVRRLELRKTIVPHVYI